MVINNLHFVRICVDLWQPVYRDKKISKKFVSVMSAHIPDVIVKPKKFTVLNCSVSYLFFAVFSVITLFVIYIVMLF